MSEADGDSEYGVLEAAGMRVSRVGVAVSAALPLATEFLSENDAHPTGRQR